MHLESAARATGRRPAELDGPPAPPEAAYLFGWFREIARARGFVPGTALALPLAWSEIAAWARLHGVTLQPWELAMLKRLDNTYLASRA